LTLPSILQAAEIARLIARESGVFLYEQQDIRSGKVIMLVKGEPLTPLVQALGPETWYLVKTQQGIVGWVLASDVSTAKDLAPSGASETNRTTAPQVSMWTARARDGRVFEGSWSLDPGTSSNEASGTWTVWDGAANVTFRGTWSATKFSTGWSGMWRAAVAGQHGEYSGSWTADVSRPTEPRLSDLFEAAGRDVIRGLWNAADSSGSWAIRAVK
jgi:hypothetical protein